jgi:hypothetical protein
MTRAFVIALLGFAYLRAEVYTTYPNHHSRVFSAPKEPVLRIKSGDSVITRTWDSGGADDQGAKHIQHPYVYPETGNPLMGPFYIEEAAYGDALEVHLDKVRLNRDYGYTCYRLDQKRDPPALPGWQGGSSSLTFPGVCPGFEWM